LPRVAFQAVQAVNSMTDDKPEAARDEGDYQLSNSRNIISRDEAKALGLKRYFTGEPCKHGHIAERYVSSGDCLECGRARNVKWRAANLEHVRELKREHRAANLEKAREKNREAARKQYIKNRDKIRSKQAAWQATNKEKIAARKRQRYAENKEKIAAYQRQWYAKNKDKVRSKHAAWRAANKNKRSPMA
jgi:hypothetical protein